MSIKQKSLFLAVIGLITTAALLYWFYLAPPESFPSKQEVMANMMDTFPEANIKEIQDIMFIDSKHVFVPFITNSESHGLSFWHWDKHEWKFISIDTGATPRMWRIDPKNPEHNVILWNFHPKNELKSLTFYIMKERGYSVTDGKENYQPKIQLEFKIELEGQTTYGFTNIPMNWQEYATSESNLMSAITPDPLFFGIFQPSYYYYGWRAMNEEGSEDYPAFPKNSHGFGTGDASVEHIRFIDSQILD